MTDTYQHTPVLLEEVISLLDPQQDHWYIDATFGAGGHSQAILNKGAKVIGFDFDQASIAQAQVKFAKEIADGRLILIRENFSRLKDAISHLKNSFDQEIRGILFDFGTSSAQLTSTERGFSFTATEEILDMRMDDRLGVRACDLLKLIDERQLAEMLLTYGGETYAKAIAKQIVKVKRSNPQSLDKVGTLVDIITQIKGYRPGSKIHPATKTFQALRIIVNNELDNIQIALPQAKAILQNSSASDKKLLCISFHEGEDRLVKTFFKQLEADCLAKILTKKAVMASERELIVNPRSRSAKLRAIALWKKNE